MIFNYPVYFCFHIEKHGKVNGIALSQLLKPGISIKILKDFFAVNHYDNN